MQNSGYHLKYSHEYVITDDKPPQMNIPQMNILNMVIHILMHIVTFIHQRHSILNQTEASSAT